MVGVAVKRTMYQRKVDVDMLNAVKSMLADVSSVSPSSEQSLSGRAFRFCWTVQDLEVFFLCVLVKFAFGVIGLS